jgi:hypothetical protein
MEYIIKDTKLLLNYSPGKGSWTYFLKIPNTKDIKGKWGDIKVSGSIDNYLLECKNLAPLKGEDKILSVNETIRKAIQKTGGDFVTVTLYLLSGKEKINETGILDSFKESDVLNIFKQLSKDEQTEVLQDILTQSTEDKQVDRIVYYIEKLSK